MVGLRPWFIWGDTVEKNDGVTPYLSFNAHNSTRMDSENVINPTAARRSDRTHSTNPYITPPHVTRISRNASAGRTLLETPPLDATRRSEESSLSPSSHTHSQSSPAEDLGAFANFDELVNALEEAEGQDADGGESDEEGEELELHEEAFALAEVDRIHHQEIETHVEQICKGNIAFVLKKGEIESNEDNEDLLAKVHKAPDGYAAAEKKDPNEPDFQNLDNPGGWSDFVFRPVYKKTGRGATANYQYVQHELPTGCTPLPKDAEGKRTSAGWELHYDGWNTDRASLPRDGATVNNLFPEERRGCLDIEVLKNLGLTKERIQGVPDSLFFLQLILPICDPKQSGIVDDPRSPYYTECTKFSNLYKYQSSIGSTYGHSVKEVENHEFVRFDGCLIRDGVRGGDGAIYRRWNKESACSDEYIQSGMTVSRWHQLKRVFKLNNNDTSPKAGQDGYNPCSKYDLIYEVICANVIALTKHAELDLTGDETTWAHQGFGEKGANNLRRVVGKPGVSKGGQIAIISATNRVRPYWYQHRHRFTPKYGQGFTAEGPAEARSSIDFLETMIEGREGSAKKIFRKPFHTSWDNYFSGEQVCHYSGSKGVGISFTTRRDRLPKEINSKYLHKQKTDSCPRSKAARYIQPVVAVLKTNDYEIVHTSFQSTSSCNIMSVNAVGDVRSFVEARSRGRNVNKRHYVIEQNLPRLLYLKTYSRIDSIDHLIKNVNLHYSSWKYWHSPANHGKSLAIVVAYDIYLECCEGKLDPEWYVKEPVGFHSFRDVLSKQGCRYHPKNQLYPGDERMRAVTQMSSQRRSDKRKSGVSDIIGDGSGKVTFEQYKEAKRAKRFCPDLMKYKVHVKSITKHKSKARCWVCGIDTWTKCGECGAPIHYNQSKGAGKGKDCHIDWHMDRHFGLCFNDRKLINKTKDEWAPWSKVKANENAQYIDRLKAASQQGRARSIRRT